ncbi:hypothetical protein [Flagellimonas eckloniae]|uniref:Uncharacterized protein n=1 Tax=Flagellimonas eckloniae TaxID=346185 RepID=A0A0N8WG07_9FLAO|nr:hypothetical protein [Allomuricauda eckloniae]KQC30171.1 hypothetical protein AAY42_09995 [Allomuricauda eckloniae]
MKQSLSILLAYLTCTDPVIITKWQNILASFWHKDEGNLVVGIQANGTDLEITLKDGEGNEAATTIKQYQEPTNFTIAKISGLQSALDAKVDKVTGKQLSTEDFTTALLAKLNSLNNYVHPPEHTIGEITDLGTTLTGLQDQLNALNDLLTDLASTQFLKWNGYRWYKNTTNTNNYPIAGEEFQGRGDGRYENGEWCHGEFKRDMPDGQATDQELDINLFTSYP